MERGQSRASQCAYLSRKSSRGVEPDLIPCTPNAEASAFIESWRGEGSRLVTDGL